MLLGFCKQDCIRKIHDYVAYYDVIKRLVIIGLFVCQVGPILRRLWAPTVAQLSHDPRSIERFASLIDESRRI